MAHRARLLLIACALLLLAGAGGWFGAAWIAGAKLEARRSASASNLHCWGSGLRFCISEHGAYPSSLSVLYEGAGVEDCPSPTDPYDESPPPPDGNGRQWSYVYVGALPADIPEWTIIAYTRPGMQPGERLVLYADEGRSVEWVTEEDLHAATGAGRRSLATSYLGVARALGDALTPERAGELRRFYGITE